MVNLNWNHYRCNDTVGDILCASLVGSIIFVCLVAPLERIKAPELDILTSLIWGVLHFTLRCFAVQAAKPEFQK